jgi:tetratricopeptide (TPR) repeat protein
VDYVLEGTIRWDRSDENEQVRVTAQLIRVRDDVHLWSESFDRPLTQVFAVQSEISERIVSAMGISLSDEERGVLGAQVPRDIEAYNDYLRGIYLMGKQTVEGFAQGREYLEAALEKDPDFAQAWAAMSAYHTFALMTGGVSVSDAYPKARAAALRALEADSSLAEGHIAMGWVYAQMEWNWVKAEKEFLRGIEISPGYSVAYLAYATLLVVMHRHEESIAKAETALRLDPLSPFVNQSLGWIYFLCGQHERAINQFRNTLEIDPAHTWARAQLAWSYAADSRFIDALAQCDTIETVYQPTFDPWLMATLSSVRAQAGESNQAQEALQIMHEAAEITFIDPINFACVYAALNRTDSCLAWLDKALEARSPVLLDLCGSPTAQRLFFGNVRSHSRYQRVMAHVSERVVK